ncbi:CyP450 monooxygenase [Cubamyces sp. BRFM 1775]|nr:CyP450 monooxygenase [Cubamyces sp. BRFM 1775]
MPTTSMSACYSQLIKKYGDLVYLDAFGQPILILGTHEAAVDLLEKRSAIYSDRTASPIVELGGFDWVMVFIGYGPLWRRHRRAIHRFFNPNSVKQFRPIQRQSVANFLMQLLSTPDDFSEHIRYLFAATIMQIAYGINIADEEEDYVTIAEEALSAFSNLLVPGKYLVELFPSLRKIPAWFPGAQFKRDTAKGKLAVHRIRDTPWERTLKLIREGAAEPSMTTAMLDRISTLPEQEASDEEELAKYITATTYGGGADTTLAAIHALFMLMASHPEVQEKAHAELDEVVGPNRLPDFSDEAALPYVSAITKECLRWHTVVPLSIPHKLIEDDEYRGYLIPKGTVVIPNVWHYSHDEQHYHNPFEFIPERFLKNGELDPDVLDPMDYAFGYGRRICPGRHFAEGSLFLIAASVLHTLSLSLPVDENGVPMKIECGVVSGVLAYPEPFKCTIKPRAPWAKALIHASYKHAGVEETLSRVP